MSTPTLSARLLAHAAVHDDIHQPEQRAWADDLREAARLLEDRAVPAGMMLVTEDVIREAAGSLGCFCSDEGWAQLDMDNLDALLALLAARQQPTADTPPTPPTLKE